MLEIEGPFCYLGYLYTARRPKVRMLRLSRHGICQFCFELGSCVKMPDLPLKHQSQYNDRQE